MKLVYSQKELKEYIGDRWDYQAYDIDDQRIIREMKYEYPILIEFMGHGAYKVRTKKDLQELQKFLDL